MNDYLQLSHQTAGNRFPKIFERIKLLKPEPKRVLSFGCSSGEECFTLSEIYPDAEIVGYDIDPGSIHKARHANKKSNLFFHTELGGTGTYDLITALMVLFSIGTPVDRSRWDLAIKNINSKLNPDGLLVIYTSEYDFMEHEVSSCYEVIKRWKRKHPRNDKYYWCGYFRKTS